MVEAAAGAGEPPVACRGAGHSGVRRPALPVRQASRPTASRPLPSTTARSSPPSGAPCRMRGGPVDARHVGGRRRRTAPRPGAGAPEDACSSPGTCSARAARSGGAAGRGHEPPRPRRPRHDGGRRERAAEAAGRRALIGASGQGAASTRATRSSSALGASSRGRAGRPVDRRQRRRRPRTCQARPSRPPAALGCETGGRVEHRGEVAVDRGRGEDVARRAARWFARPPVAGCGDQGRDDVGGPPAPAGRTPAPPPRRGAGCARRRPRR